MRTIHLVTAEHFEVPGLIQKAFASRALADIEAADLVNIMMKDSGWKPTAKPDAWEKQYDRLQDYHGAAHCYVEVTELPVAGTER